MTVHYPKSREEWLGLRAKHVGSTESSALFGHNSRLTAYELALIKRGDITDDFEGNERTEWGLLLQRTIAVAVAERYGVKIRAMNGYVSRDGLGSSFDFEIVGISDMTTESDLLRKLYEQHGAGVLEIKNVDWMVWKNDWSDDLPPHIDIQVQHQLEACEREWTALGVLVGGNKLEVLTRLRDRAVGKSISYKVAQFWKKLAAGELPPCMLPADAAVIAQLYAHAEPGKVKDAQGDNEITQLAREYSAASKAEKDAKAARESAKAKLLMKIGDAEKVLCTGYTISAGVVGETLVEAYTRSAYRNFQVRAKKQENRT